MNPGEMTSVLSFKAITSTVSSGNITEAEATAVNVRGKLKQLSGYKKMIYTEIANCDIYSFECYDNAVLTRNSVCLSGSTELTVYDVTKNIETTGTNEVKVILYKK